MPKSKPTPAPDLPQRKAYVPPIPEKADVYAIQALAGGRADEAQQKRALAFIINGLAATYDWAYRPGDEGDRDTLIALGRQFVGQQIVFIINVNAAVLFRGNNAGPESEQGR